MFCGTKCVTTAICICTWGYNVLISFCFYDSFFEFFELIGQELGLISNGFSYYCGLTKQKTVFSFWHCENPYTYSFYPSWLKLNITKLFNLESHRHYNPGIKFLITILIKESSWVRGAAEDNLQVIAKIIIKMDLLKKH